METGGSSSSELRTLSVTKLKSADGYNVWSTRLEMFLMGAKLWSIVDGSHSAPSSTAPSTSTSSGGTELETWKADDAKAKYYISSTVSDEVMLNSTIRGTSKELWDSIKKAYGTAGEERVYQVYNKLINLRMTSSDTIGEHVASMKGLLQQIEAMGENQSDKFKIAVLLGSLPEEYDVKRQVLYEKKDAKFEDVCSSIIGHVTTGESTNVFRAHQKSGKGKKSGEKGTKKSGFCTHCKKDGHTVENCFKLPGVPWKKNKEKGKGKEVAGAATQSNEDGEFILSAVVEAANLANAKGDPRDHWTVDTGASRYITPFLDILHDVQEIKPITIYLAGKG
jgi:hypothetical protein